MIKIHLRKLKFDIILLMRDSVSSKIKNKNITLIPGIFTTWKNLDDSIKEQSFKRVNGEIDNDRSKTI